MILSRPPMVRSLRLKTRAGLADYVFKRHVFLQDEYLGKFSLIFKETESLPAAPPAVLLNFLFNLRVQLQGQRQEGLKLKASPFAFYQLEKTIRRHAGNIYHSMLHGVAGLKAAFTPFQTHIAYTGAVKRNPISLFHSTENTFLAGMPGSYGNFKTLLSRIAASGEDRLFFPNKEHDRRKHVTTGAISKLYSSFMHVFPGHGSDVYRAQLIHYLSLQNERAALPAAAARHFFATGSLPPVAVQQLKLMLLKTQWQKHGGRPPLLLSFGIREKDTSIYPFPMLAHMAAAKGSITRKPGVAPSFAQPHLAEGSSTAASMALLRHYLTWLLPGHSSFVYRSLLTYLRLQKQGEMLPKDRTAGERLISSGPQALSFARLHGEEIIKGGKMSLLRHYLTRLLSGQRQSVHSSLLKYLRLQQDREPLAPVGAYHVAGDSQRTDSAISLAALPSVWRERSNILFSHGSGIIQRYAMQLKPAARSLSALASRTGERDWSGHLHPQTGGRSSTGSAALLHRYLTRLLPGHSPFVYSSLLTYLRLQSEKQPLAAAAAQLFSGPQYIGGASSLPAFPMQLKHALTPPLPFLSGVGEKNLLPLSTLAPMQPASLGIGPAARDFSPAHPQMGGQSSSGSMALFRRYLMQLLPGHSPLVYSSLLTYLRLQKQGEGLFREETGTGRHMGFDGTGGQMNTETLSRLTRYVNRLLPGAVVAAYGALLRASLAYKGGKSLPTGEKASLSSISRFKYGDMYGQKPVWPEGGPDLADLSQHRVTPIPGALRLRHGAGSTESMIALIRENFPGVYGKRVMEMLGRGAQTGTGEHKPSFTPPFGKKSMHGGGMAMLQRYLTRLLPGYSRPVYGALLNYLNISRGGGHVPGTKIAHLSSFSHLRERFISPSSVAIRKSKADSAVPLLQLADTITARVLQLKGGVRTLSPLAVNMGEKSLPLNIPSYRYKDFPFPASSHIYHLFKGKNGIPSRPLNLKPLTRSETILNRQLETRVIKELMHVNRQRGDLLASLPAAGGKGQGIFTQTELSPHRHAAATAAQLLGESTGLQNVSNVERDRNYAVTNNYFFRYFPQITLRQERAVSAADNLEKSGPYNARKPVQLAGDFEKQATKQFQFSSVEIDRIVDRIYTEIQRRTRFDRQRMGL